VLKRKAADSISKQKMLAKKRSHPTATNSQLAGERKEDLTNWLDREITSALCLKELRGQIDSHQAILEDAETRKQQLTCQNVSDETTVALLRDLCVEIEMRLGIVDQLEKNADEIFNAARKNPQVSKKHTCLLESAFWQSLSRSEVRYIFNEFFISMVDEKYQYASQKECHDALISTEIGRAVEEQKRQHEKLIFNLNIQHSSTITDLLESTKATIQADIGDKLTNKISEDGNTDEDLKLVFDQMLNRYMQSCTKISDSVRMDLNNIKATQDSMKTIVDDVAVGLISHNEASAALMSKKKTKRNPVLEEPDLSESENDNDETVVEDSDDSDWSPEDTSAARPSKKKRHQEVKIDGLPGSQIGGNTLLDEANYEKMTCLDLRKLLRERGLMVRGRKAELIARLKDNTKSELSSIHVDDDTAKITEEKTMNNSVESGAETGKSPLRMGKKRALSTKEDIAINRSKKKVRSSGDSHESTSPIVNKRRLVLSKEDNAGNRLKKKSRSSDDSCDGTTSLIDNKSRILSTKEGNTVKRSKKKLRPTCDNYDSASSIDSVQQKSSAGGIRRLKQRSNSISISPSNSILSKISTGSKRRTMQASNGKPVSLLSARKAARSSSVERSNSTSLSPSNSILSKISTGSKRRTMQSSNGKPVSLLSARKAARSSSVERSNSTSLSPSNSILSKKSTGSKRRTMQSSSGKLVSLLSARKAARSSSVEHSNSTSISPSNSILSKISTGSKRRTMQSSSGKLVSLLSARKVAGSVSIDYKSMARNISRSYLRKSPPTPARNSRQEESPNSSIKEVSLEGNDTLDTRLAPKRLRPDKDTSTIRNPFLRATTKHPSTTSDEGSDSCPSLRRSSRLVPGMKENYDSALGQQTESTQVYSIMNDPLATITNSAQKRKRNRRQSMAKSVSRAMMQLKALAEG